ncbi:tumor suppressor candidate 5-like protein [Labeo rohita]|uniref:Tumor suppressor candidate 5-like protein n=1 Tax=Labeo rohita TaxID=84645 RepID=A0A498LBR6_LABRO|nr:tumor suppressor candidate 5-like protein [Labeo rohita]
MYGRNGGKVLVTPPLQPTTFISTYKTEPEYSIAYVAAEHKAKEIAIRRMDPRLSSNQPPGARNSSEKPEMTRQPYPGVSGVTVQPAVFVTAAPLANPVPDYLPYSIFVTVCCCLPLGIAALIYSCSTRDANFSGQRELAEKNSKMARTLNHIGLGIGICIIVVVIISQIVFWTRLRTYI